MLESHASSVDEKPSMWSQISSSILTMLSTRSSVSEASIVVVIFSLPPLRISAADELRLYRTPQRRLSVTIIRMRSARLTPPHDLRYTGNWAAAREQDKARRAATET